MRLLVALHPSVGCLVVACACGTALAQTQVPETFPAEQIRVGEKHYSQNCAPCHGTRMQEPPVRIDLRQFPRGQRARFITVVTNGRNTMPPWRGALTPEEIDALWAYVSAGEPN
jgi:mono/diheme cytochrome c family protein